MSDKFEMQFLQKFLGTTNERLEELYRKSLGKGLRGDDVYELIMLEREQQQKKIDELEVKLKCTPNELELLKMIDELEEDLKEFLDIDDMEWIHEEVYDHFKNAYNKYQAKYKGEL